MKLAKGVRRSITQGNLSAEDVTLVLERLETAVPHLTFSNWRLAKDADEREAPRGEVLWKSSKRLQITARIHVHADLCLWALCERDSGAIPTDDYELVLNLVDEAARTVASSVTSEMSLFDFGTAAVAEEIQRRTEIETHPLALLRFVRSLAQETYENQRLSYGVIISSRRKGLNTFAEAFDNKRVKRLTDGFSTALLLGGDGRFAGYAALTVPKGEGERLPRRPWWSAGLAELSARERGVGIALMRSGDMLVVHRGRMLFSQRAGRWRVWSHQAILNRLRAAWTSPGNPRGVTDVLSYLYHVALDLSFRRSGGLLVVLSRTDRLNHLLTSKTDKVGAGNRGAAERSLDEMVRQNRMLSLDRRIITDLASLDGALVVDRSGKVLAYGAMTKTAGGRRQGARTRAAIAASREGLAIKISSDGEISFFAGGDCLLEI